MSYKTASMKVLSLVLILGIFCLEAITIAFSHSQPRVACKAIERKALLQFKQGLTDPSGRLSSWVGEECCRWRGVSCNNRTGSVIKLKLNNIYLDSSDMDSNGILHKLGGEINPSLLHLKDLVYLDLSMNDFIGVQIPDFFGSLEKLKYLNLSGASFTGTIPQSLGNLSNLLYIDLNNPLNQPNESDLRWLSGLSSLKYLNLGGVDLSKAAAYWLQTVNMLHSLVELHLPNCELFHLPQNLPSLNFTSLLVLDLSNNGFNSTIPHWLFNISSLVNLDLNSNNLQGKLPEAFASLNSLQQLDLSGNSYIGGRLPRSLGKLCNLQTLKLSRNNITGEITELINALSGCTNSSSIMSLQLGYNKLTGNLPISLGYLNNLRYLHLWHNSFQGSIPSSIGNLSSLEEFYLSSNQMNGMPESLGQLSALKLLDLSENLWEGVITQAHFMNLSSLTDLSLNKPSPNITLVFNISSDWIPPFKLRYIKIRSCQLGPKFPIWLRNQSDLTTVVLNNARISDTIPDWFWQLDLKLQELDVAYNQLSGKVPNSIGFLNPSTVDLSSNKFEGRLPLWSSNVTKLYLRDNLFSGPIPHDIGEVMPFLMDLDLSYSSLNGSIPMSIGNLTELSTLVISHNHLSGEIPEWNNIPFLFILEMSDNNLSGPMPKSIGSLSSVMFLILSNNNLSGELPPSLQNCTSMDSLDLGDNKLSGNLPAWIGESMPSVSILSLRSNFLSILHLLDLSNNDLSGFIPPCLGNLSGMKVKPSETEQYEGSLQLVTKGRVFEYSTTLYLVNSIDLSKNNLSGEMPIELTSLVHLGTLNLSWNHLTGNIPLQMGNLEWLETLDLSRNKLSGPIPQTMASLRFLNHLNLSYNNLSGEIPSTNQFQTLLDPSIYEGNQALCGHPLPKECQGRDKTAQVPADGDEFDKLWLFTSMGLGFIVGFWGFCGTLILKKSWRYAYYHFLDKTKDRLLLVVLINFARLKRKLSEMRGSDQTQM
ncbi:hypothetical protein ACOSQ4_001972 [Xanthoceras sorbifolium]